MINKIKDKQTGEYHDIGNLKCKLVAEGILEIKDNNTFKPVYNFEEGKTYFIFIDANGGLIQFVGTYYNNMLSSQFTSDWSTDRVVCLCIDADGTYLFDTSFSFLSNYVNSIYKVYELPLALEV